MQIEIDGYVFDIDVKHYEPEIPGSYDFFADNDFEFFGVQAEVVFDVFQVYDIAGEVKYRLSKDKNEVVDEYYSIIYNKVLEQMAVN